MPNLEAKINKLTVWLLQKRCQTVQLILSTLDNCTEDDSFKLH